ncbi:MAG: glycoside hydrolase family 4 [Opitutales bacterium]
MIKPPKIVVVGAGSLFFGRKAIWSMCQQDGLKGGTLALVDTDPEHLATMRAIAERAIAATGCDTRLETSEDVRELLPGADFVILSFSNRNAHYRRFDAQISEKYGIYLCSADTIGPGGIFRAMRELPVILKTAEAVRELAPQAWLINYINPTSVNGIALMRHFPDLKSFALCDTLHMPYVKHHFMRRAGVPDAEAADFDLRIAGVNHFTFALKMEHRGRDMSDALRAHMRELAADEKDAGYSKKRFNNTYSLQLWDIFGACPACIGHTKEYLPYYQHRDHGPVKERRLTVFDCDEREERTATFWEENRAWASGQADIAEFLEKTQADHATNIINAMVTDSGRSYYINTANQGAVGNLPDDSFLEVLCEVSMDAVRPQPTGTLPLGLRSLQLNVLDTHELTVEAIVRQDSALLRRAFLTDPLVESIPDTDAMIAELLEAQRAAIEPHLPGFYVSQPQPVTGA